jgi:hypothetical protein
MDEMRGHLDVRGQYIQDNSEDAGDEIFEELVEQYNRDLDIYESLVIRINHLEESLAQDPEVLARYHAMPVEEEVEEEKEEQRSPSNQPPQKKNQRSRNKKKANK